MDSASEQSVWGRALSERDERYGADASDSARAAAADFERARLREVLELGAGQGRDTIFLAGRGFDVCAVHFATSGLRSITAKAARAGLDRRVRVRQHDAREPLPFEDASFDACYSPMLYCMALSETELAALNAEVHRVLRPGNVNVYTARSTADPDCGKGTHHGEGLYELDGFTVHFFDRATVKRLAVGFDVVAVDEIEEGDMPRRLLRVTLRRTGVVPTRPRSDARINLR